MPIFIPACYSSEGAQPRPSCEDDGLEDQRLYVGSVVGLPPVLCSSRHLQYSSAWALTDLVQQIPSHRIHATSRPVYNSTHLCDQRIFSQSATCPHHPNCPASWSNDPSQARLPPRHFPRLGPSPTAPFHSKCLPRCTAQARTVKKKWRRLPPGCVRALVSERIPPEFKKDRHPLNVSSRSRDSAALHRYLVWEIQQGDMKSE